MTAADDTLHARCLREEEDDDMLWLEHERVRALVADSPTDPDARWEWVCATTEDLIDFVMHHPTPGERYAALHGAFFTLLHRLSE